MFLSHDTIFSGCSVTVVSAVIPGKQFLVKQFAKSFDIYGCKIENLKVGSMPAAYPADSRKAFCEVCNNAIIAKHCELDRHNW